MLDEFEPSIAASGENAAPAALYPTAPRAVQRALDHIHVNLAAPMRLGEIAGAARMSVYHFSRTFRKATGIGPHRYLVQARIERVKDLLHSGSRSLAEIADAAGFSDQSHMSRVFRRFTGMTPKAYRASRPVSRCPLQAYFAALRGGQHAG